MTYRVVEIEQWIYGDVPNLRYLSAENEANRDEPLGVHFGPLRQFGPAFDGQKPNRSLSIEVNVTEEWNEASRRHTPSDDLVNGSMSAITTFEQCLEPDEVAWETVHHGLDTFWGEECVERVGYGWSSVSEATGTWDRGVVPTDAVWDRIRALEIEGEASGRDLVVVLGVAPSAEPRFWIWIKEGRSREVVEIWDRGNENLRGGRSCTKEGQTFGPVPIWLCSLESAFLAQSTLEPVGVRTMPRQEMSREMDLVNQNRRGKG